MVLIAVVADGISDKQSLVGRASGKVGVSQDKENISQLQVDEQAVWLIVQQVEEFRKCEQELSKIFVLNLEAICELVNSIHELISDDNTNLGVLLIGLSIAHVVPCVPIHRLVYNFGDHLINMVLQGPTDFVRDLCCACRRLLRRNWTFCHRFCHRSLWQIAGDLVVGESGIEPGQGVVDALNRSLVLVHDFACSLVRLVLVRTICRSVFFA